jgi:HSP20 family molecular chaperone IbpA
MSNEQELNTATAEATTAESLRTQSETIRPETDIYVNNEGITLLVNMPGVAKGDVIIEIDDANVMSISAKNVYVEPESPLLQQFVTGNYYRAFKLGEEYDNDKVVAALSDGLLTLTIERKEKAKPRTIEISA